MKKQLFILLCCIFVQYAFGQSVSEKLIVKLPGKENANSYSLKYDSRSGAWAYESYDTTTRRSKMISSKGTTKDYAGIMTYNAFFDKDGNVYVVSFENVTDTSYKYFLLKNSEEIGTYEYIKDNFAEKNGVLYFAVKENGKTSVATIELSNGKMTKGKAYDDVTFVYYPEKSYEGEPVGYPGFTKSGDVYYVATDGTQKCMVIGDKEQKKYADIDIYNFAEDNAGNVVYTANDKGPLYDTKGSTFIVQGANEYKKFDNVYGPILFDNANNPVYIGADASAEGSSITPQRVMSGSTELSKTYTGWITDLQLTPQGKLAFIASDYIDTTHSSYCAVVDGKETPKYNNVFNLTVSPAGEPVYSAQVGDKYYVMKSDKKLTGGVANIVEYKLLPNGKLCYITAIYGDYNKGKTDKFYFYAGDEKSGPYDFLGYGDEGYGSNITTDDAGNFAYIASKLIDKKNYVYSYTAYSNKGNSDEFDSIGLLRMVKGKVFFSASNYTDKKNFIQTSRLYSNFEPVSKEYNSITTLNTNANDPVQYFTAAKGNEIYLLEVKF